MSAYRKWTLASREKISVSRRIRSSLATSETTTCAYLFQPFDLLLVPPQDSGEQTDRHRDEEQKGCLEEVVDQFGFGHPDAGGIIGSRAHGRRYAPADPAEVEGGQGRGEIETDEEAAREPAGA